MMTSLLTAALLGGGPPVTSIGLEEMAHRLRGDVRVIVMGDSFSSPYINRMPLSTLQSWPIPFISAGKGTVSITVTFPDGQTTELSSFEPDGDIVIRKVEVD